MELELNKERFDCYRAGAPIALSFEETAETIVPDHSPDIARIVDVSACLLLRDRIVADGKLTASGSVKLTLLYVAEDAPGLRALDYAVPFEHSAGLPAGCTDVCVEGRVCGAEARLLNPRKLLTRFDIDWKLTPYCKTTLSVCGEIVDREKYAIQTLCERRDVSLIRSVGVSDFLFSDELTIPGGREPIGELLRSQVRLRLNEAKSLGSRIVLKGVACLSLLYAAADGTPCAYAEELPFSQLLDGAENAGESAVSAALSLSGSEIHIGEDGGYTVSVKLFITACVMTRVSESVCCITDLYSTTHDLDAQMETVELRQAPEVTTVTQNVREQLDTGTEVRRVLSADVCFGSVGVRQEGERAALRAAATVSVLYLDEADAPLSIRRRIEITAEAAVGNAQAGLEDVCAGDISANINAGGVELRFPAEFTLVSFDVSPCACLTGLSAESAKPDADAPSLVLRALEAGETLWDVAKQYRTTAEDILAANELTENAPLEAGRMLLIPRSR